MSKNEMIMLPREVVEQALESLLNEGNFRKLLKPLIEKSINTLSAALEHPQPDATPYLYYDPNNGDTWTQEAINDGCCLPDGLISLYTK